MVTEPSERKQRPIVPYLRLPAGSGEEAYLVGCRCSKCSAVFLGSRQVCAKCSTEQQFEKLKLSHRGEVYVWSIVHQSAPGIKVPYVAAIVDLPEGVAVRANIEGIEPEADKIEFGMPVEMYTEVVRQDREGNDIVAYKFRPIGA